MYSSTVGGEMPLVKTAAIVLHSRKWGDADRIVTFYTMRLGKMRGVARGARRLKSRLGGMIEPFTLCHLDLFEKPGDSLYRISQVAQDEPFAKFRSDLTLMAAAGRMVNFVSAVMADGDAEPRVFEMLESKDYARCWRVGMRHGRHCCFRFVCWE